MLRLIACAVAAAGLVACNGGSDGVREWRPDDHDQPAPMAGQVAARPTDSAAPHGAAPELVELAWQRNCATCHGMRGRGDGPQGPMLRVADLTRPDWQQRVTDAQIAEVIRKGRNKMPAFDLPPQVIDGLVARIRALRSPD